MYMSMSMSFATSMYMYMSTHMHMYIRVCRPIEREKLMRIPTEVYLFIYILAIYICIQG